MSEVLLSYYGDDLTGSTDVMEALASRGVATVLFIETPTTSQRARFPHVRAIGLANDAKNDVATDDDAVFADALDGGTNFHFLTPGSNLPTDAAF